MLHLPITPRRVAPYVISGATGVHILARMRYLSRQPALDIPLHFFLLKHTDVLLSLGSASVVIWQLAKHKPRQYITAARSNGAAVNTLNTSVVANIVHELRQTFTALLLGLGLVDRKADTGNTVAIPDLVKRLIAVVRRGMEAVDTLELSESSDGLEREYGA